MCNDDGCFSRVCPIEDGSLTCLTVCSSRFYRLCRRGMGERTSSETPKNCPTQVSGHKDLGNTKGTSKDLSTQAAHHGVNLKPESGTTEWLQRKKLLTGIPVWSGRQRKDSGH